ncbi:MAG: hypothetical protein AVDCRST_MAG54-2201, partial [uncultured Actinomycetospora sp.]
AGRRSGRPGRRGPAGALPPPGPGVGAGPRGRRERRAHLRRRRARGAAGAVLGGRRARPGPPRCALEPVLRSARRVPAGGRRPGAPAGPPARVGRAAQPTHPPGPL